MRTWFRFIEFWSLLNWVHQICRWFPLSLLKSITLQFLRQWPIHKLKGRGGLKIILLSFLDRRNHFVFDLVEWKLRTKKISTASSSWIYPVIALVYHSTLHHITPGFFSSSLRILFQFNWPLFEDLICIVFPPNSLSLFVIEFGFNPTSSLSN